MIAVSLDTSAYSRLMRGSQGLKRRLEEVDVIHLPVTVLGELYAGFKLGRRCQENLAELAEFRRQPGVGELDLTDNIAERYGWLVQVLREQGTPIPTNDIWIAAAALESGGRLVAYDVHFERVPGLLIESP